MTGQDSIPQNFRALLGQFGILQLKLWKTGNNLPL